MSQIAAPFAYSDHTSANRKDGPQACATILADRPHLRDTLADQVLEAGLVLHQAEPLDRMLAEDPLVLGDIVIVDCPVPDAALLAALARLDARAAQTGAQLIVATKPEGIDAIFGAMDTSHVQFLVDPDGSEYALALGVAISKLPHRSVNEMSHEDHLALVRLTEQVHSLARRLGGMEGIAAAKSSVQSPSIGYLAPVEKTLSRSDEELVLELPQASLVREIIRQRQLRASFFDAELFADPAWDMLLDLTAARAEGQDVCVSSLCIASGVPATTALRWIGQLTECGLFERLADPADRRRAIIRLSRKAQNGISAYFARLGPSALAI